MEARTPKTEPDEDVTVGTEPKVGPDQVVGIIMAHPKVDAAEAAAEAVVEVATDAS